MGCKITNDRIDILIANRHIQRMESVNTFHTLNMWNCLTCNHSWLATPNNIINRTTGCPACRIVNATLRNKRNTLTTEEFISKAHQIHGSLYDYSRVEYKRSSVPVQIRCNIHGWFNQRPNTHLCGSGCKQCNMDKSVELKHQRAASSFISRAQAIHGILYDYTHCVYKNNEIPIEIHCPHHGAFVKKPRVHLSGIGCPTCTSNQKGGHYTQATFDSRPYLKEKPAYLYILQLMDKKANLPFVKVGITRQAQSQNRIRAYSTMECQVLKIVSGLTLYKAYMLEQQFLREFKNYKYTPIVKFSGYTECLVYTENYAALYLNYLEN